MIYPNSSKLNEYFENYDLIPICKELRADFETPLSLFLKVNGSFLLESVEQGTNVGRYSIIGVGKKVEFIIFEKKLVTKYYEDEILLSTLVEIKDNPLNVVINNIEKRKVLEYEFLPPFYGGLIGYLGYETIQYFEKIPVRKDNNELPDAYLIIPDTVLIFDSVKRTVMIVKILEKSENNIIKYDKYVNKIELLSSKIQLPFSSFEKNTERKLLNINFTTNKNEFIETVKKCKKYIVDGEIIQVVISQRIDIETSTHPFELYRTLRILNPSPYMFYLDFGEFQIIGSSPEVMVRVHNREILLKPIAGTRIRGATIEEDKKIENELLKDPKERAEHVMLVDLGRNDVGKVASAGTVIVTDYMKVEKYSHVMHLVSTIKGILDVNKNLFDVIKATFPAGTLTGAPKIRAMEIIYELEKFKRGPYGGMILNLGYNLNLDSCITIRTIVFKDKIARIQAGAGIVADSDPELEYLETINKASVLIKTIECTQNGGLL